MLTVPRRLMVGFILPRAELPLQSSFSQLFAPCTSRSTEAVRPKLKHLKGLRVPSSRYQPVVSTCHAELPAPRYVPSSAFHPPSTVFSTTCLVGLFHPTTTSRVFPSGVWPHHRAVPGFPRSLPSCRFLRSVCLSEDGSNRTAPASGLCSLW